VDSAHGPRRVVGTDFNDGMKCIGPKKALKLVQEHGRLEAMPEYIRQAGDVSGIRRLYLEPDVTDDYEIVFGKPDLAGIVTLLCDEREFGKDRVTAALDRTFRAPTLF
jgi:flap endonuclease-1